MWHPWRRLRELAHVELIWSDEPSPLGLTRFAGPTITLSKHQSYGQRRSTLTHELIHLERGPYPFGYRDAEEIAVDRLAAKRLIGIRELGEALAWTDGQPTAETAEELCVDFPMLTVRLQHLHPAERAYLRRRLTEGAQHD